METTGTAPPLSRAAQWSMPRGNPAELKPRHQGTSHRRGSCAACLAASVGAGTARTARGSWRRQVADRELAGRGKSVKERPSEGVSPSKAASQTQVFLGRQPRFWQSLDIWTWTAELQCPDIPLPETAKASVLPDEKVREFQKNGVVLIPAAIAEWVPYLKLVVQHQMEHPQVSAFVTGLRSFFSMDYVQAGLFLTNDGFFDFWKHSNAAAMAAQLLQCTEVRLIVDQLNVNPHCPPFTDTEKFHTDVGVISSVARKEDVIRCWIPLEKGRQEGIGTLEFEVHGERKRFKVQPGDVLMFTPSIPHRVLFPPSNVYEEDRCVVIASLHGSDGSQELPTAVPEFPRLFPAPDEAELAARRERRLYSSLERYFDLWGNPFTLADEWMQFITYDPDKSDKS